MDRQTRIDQVMSQFAAAWEEGQIDPTPYLEMVSEFESVLGRSLPIRNVPRRPGDVASSYANPSRAETKLDWKATRSVRDMCQDSWNWQFSNPNGYVDN